MSRGTRKRSNLAASAWRHDEAGSLALGRTDRPEDVGPLRAPIVRGTRAGAAPGPPPRDPILLANPGLVLPPELYDGAGRELRPDRFQSVRQSFLNSSNTASFWA